MKELLSANLRGNLQTVVQVRSFAYLEVLNAANFIHQTQDTISMKRLARISWNFGSWDLHVISSSIAALLSARSDQLLCSCINKVAKEYAEQLGMKACIKLFDQFKSYEGLYFFLSAFVGTRFALCPGLSSTTFFTVIANSLP